MVARRLEMLFSFSRGGTESIDFMQPCNACMQTLDGASSRAACSTHPSAVRGPAPRGPLALPPVLYCRSMTRPVRPRAVPTVVIVGAGPAGFAAALAAARRGASVRLCEQLPRAGAKLLVTGGGRCNLTNTLPPDEFMARFGRDGRFMQPALAAMDSSRLRALMAELGAPTHAPGGFLVYPVSDSARTIQQALLRACADAGVELLSSCEVRGLVLDRGSVAGAMTALGPIGADAVLLATGGRSYPELGATGSGYALARQAGHRITPLLPVLVPLRTRETWPRECAGVSVSRTRVWIDLPKHRAGAVDGDVLFTHSGISGPAVLDLSRSVVPLLQEQPEVPVRVRLAPGVPDGDWPRLFAEWRTAHGRKHVANLLDRYLPARLAHAAIRSADVPDDVTAASLTRGQGEALTGTLSGARLTITGAGGFDQAMVTRGGVSLKEVHPASLESRLVRGLFFAGEILDLDGPCGGYNLQWSFSSGWLAGASAAEAAKRAEQEGG